MTREQFGRGLQLINSVTTNQLDTNDQIETYFLLLGDLEGEQYLRGIISLLKTKKNMYTAPSPAEIIEFYNKEMDNYLNIENILDYIKRDILMCGKRHKPNYKKEIDLTINKLGGWEYLCNINHNIDSLFKEEYKKIISLENLLES